MKERTHEEKRKKENIMGRSLYFSFYPICHPTSFLPSFLPSSLLSSRISLTKLNLLCSPSKLRHTELILRKLSLTMLKLWKFSPSKLKSSFHSLSYSISLSLSLLDSPHSFLPSLSPGLLPQPLFQPLPNLSFSLSAPASPTTPIRVWCRRWVVSPAINACGKMLLVGVNMLQLCESILFNQGVKPGFAL